MFDLLEATEPQKLFWEDQSKFKAFIAGIGAGKTFAGALELLRMPPGTRAMVLAPTFPMLRTASLQAFMDIARPAGLIKSFNKADYDMTLPGDRLIYWRSADNPDRLRGPSLGLIWLDEAAMMSEQTWLIVVGRLRQSGAPNKAFMTTTPRGTRHWLYDLVKRGKLSVTTATSASNTFNPADYVESVATVGSADWQRQELLGEFVEPGGTLFKRPWFQMVDKLPDEPRTSVRAWDCAATAGGGDYSVGLRMHRIGDKYYIDHIIRGQFGPDELDVIQRQTAESDGQDVSILLEREPGSAGKRANQYLRHQLNEYHVVEEKATGSKLNRAMPAARAASSGGVVLVKGNWITAFLDEVIDFNGLEEDGTHDDQVDAFALAFNFLFRRGMGMVLA